MFITHEKFRNLFSNLMDDDLYSWRLVSHNNAFTWLYVCNEVLVPTGSDVIPAVKHLMMHDPLQLDTLIEAQSEIGRVLSVLLMRAPAQGGTQYRPCTVQRVLRFKSESGDPRHVYEIDDKTSCYSHGKPLAGDELKVVFDAGNLGVC
ncbi:hypothetical protein EAH74_12005 [Pseudomonas mandelii]|uniref:Uncharacterized protein n=1 Tax=Pseudomonas mandelii TaxID=75612 RepID=A0A502IFG0_9PSED|nr:hypothetical protein EAH74_12005 [Pseudomonas mandelii]